ncbi:uncharacterized protein [Temnothorax nylanderi]
MEGEQEFTVLNKNNEEETVTFASDEMLESIQMEDSTVEIIGFVDEIDGPKIVGKTQHYRLLKFVLNNNSQHRVQIVAWNDEIDRIKNFLQPNRIIHIDGAKAKKPKIPDFNIGTLPYELIIRSNTVINHLGTFDIKKNISMQTEEIQFKDVCNHLNSYICIRGFIKTRFNSFSNNFKTYGCGSITNGEYKLEIQIVNYDEFVDNFEKGQEIEVKGYVQIANDIFYLNVENKKNIKTIEGSTMTFLECLKGNKSIMKKSLMDNDLIPTKIARKE